MFVFIFYGVVRRIFPSLRMCRRIDIELDSAAPTVSYYYSYSRKRYLCRGWLLLSSSPSPSLSSSRPSCCRCSSSIVSFMRCFGDASSPHNTLLLRATLSIRHLTCCTKLYLYLYVCRANHSLTPTGTDTPTLDRGINT